MAIGDPNNLEKLKAIYLAMSKVNEIDKSDYFKNYYSEVLGRIMCHVNVEMSLCNSENKSIEDQESIINSFFKI